MESGVPGMREEAECLVRGFKPRAPGEAMSLRLPTAPFWRSSEVWGWGGDKGTWLAHIQYTLSPNILQLPLQNCQIVLEKSLRLFASSTT